MRMTIITAALNAVVLLGACQPEKISDSEAGATTSRAVTTSNWLPDTVPLPDDPVIGAPVDGMDPDLARWYGAWAGKWGGRLDSIIIVEQVAPDGTGQVIYAWADYGPWNITKGWSRERATIEGNTMMLERFPNGAQASFTFRADGALGGVYERAGRSGSYGTFTRGTLE